MNSLISASLRHKILFSSIKTSRLAQYKQSWGRTLLHVAKSRYTVSSWLNREQYDVIFSYLGRLDTSSPSFVSSYARRSSSLLDTRRWTVTMAKRLATKKKSYNLSDSRKLYDILPYWASRDTTHCSATRKAPSSLSDSRQIRTWLDSDHGCYEAHTIGSTSGLATFLAQLIC